MSAKRSLQFQVLVGGRYVEYKVTGSGTDMRQATACKSESTSSSVNGLSFRTRIPAPPLGLALLSRLRSFIVKVYCLLQNRYELGFINYCKQNATGW
jgi:hypothetical protein